MKKCKIADEIEFDDKSKAQFNGFGLYDSDSPTIKDNRYYLEIDLNSDNKKPVLVAFMINPSKTLPEINGKKSTIDGTVKNLIKISHKNYSKLIVLNLHSTINPEQKELKRNPVNDSFVKKFLSKDIDNFTKKDLLIACGHDKDKKYADKIKEIIRNYKEKYNKILYLSVNIDKFSEYIKDKILHPSRTSISFYGGIENLEFRELKF